jgi:3-hydroxyisobutyrate dehydrogenase
MIAMVTGLVEATHFIERRKLDLSRLVSILDAGPMASDLSRMKSAMLLAKDFSAQAAISNVLEGARLITGAAREAGIAHARPFTKTLATSVSAAPISLP